jgi:hypothetical protein
MREESSVVVRRMPFVPPRSSNPRPLRGQGAILSVGRRVFVNCPAERSRRIPLTDEAGETAAESLADGTEVEILAWRPRGAGGPRYRVHSTTDGLEGWLGAGALRTTPRPAPPPSPAPGAAPPTTPTPPVGASRKFGQR